MAFIAVTLRSFAIIFGLLQVVAASQVHGKLQSVSVAVSASAGMAANQKIARHAAQNSIMKAAPQDPDKDVPSGSNTAEAAEKAAEAAEDAAAAALKAAGAASSAASAARRVADDARRAEGVVSNGDDAGSAGGNKGDARSAGGKHADASGDDHTITDQPAERVAAKGCNSGKTTVSIEVYYETRCPGCMEFFNKTLETLWRNAGMKKTLNISMIAFGNAELVPTAQISEGYKTFHKDTTGTGFDYVQVCQHGPEECFGNLVEVCAKDIAHTAAALLQDSEEKEKEHDKYMNLIFCMSSKTLAGFGAENAAYECLEETGINKHKVRECVQGPRGNKLIAEAGQQTLALKEKKGTPWVVINGVHARDKVLMDETLLTKAVCSHVCNAPEPCAPFVGSQGDVTPAETPLKEEPDFEVLAKDDFIQLDREHI